MNDKPTRFTALKDFWSDETKSQYTKGMGYNINNEKLEKLVEGWVADGNVEYGGAHAKIAGVGTVE